MTMLDVVYRLGSPPSAAEMSAIAAVREVYGIRKISFENGQQTVRVEFDASRLCERTVATMLRNAGFDVRERVTLV